jgi:hypothetical protein
MRITLDRVGGNIDGNPDRFGLHSTAQEDERSRNIGMTYHAVIGGIFFHDSPAGQYVYQ